MQDQTEALAPAQAYDFTTAQAMNDLYLSFQRRGDTPNAYAVDGDMTTIRKSA